MTTARIVDVLPDGSLPLSAMKEQLSVAYIEMLTAAAGCSILDYSVDFDAIDISIRSSVEYTHRHGPQLDVQLKCTSQDVVRQNHVSWRIDERSHKLLTSKKRSCPIILALLIVPGDHNTWLDHDETRLLTESVMYWIPGVDIAAYPAGQETMTVEIPRENRLTRESLLGIMHEIGEGSPGWRI
ncbi:DUF4365 domain-containing protein [Mycobacterium sp. 20091114027_K0903767]|nr:DUF4365 domain-containing protein [Mycobacterium sp. 20091114027_K0903767]